MIALEEIKSLQHGSMLTITNRQGNQIELSVHKGDALLRGGNQIWLKPLQDSGKYLRRLPSEQTSLGFALFETAEDLFQTLQSGNYYIG